MKKSLTDILRGSLAGLAIGVAVLCGSVGKARGDTTPITSGQDILNAYYGVGYAPTDTAPINNYSNLQLTINNQVPEDKIFSMVGFKGSYPAWLADSNEFLRSALEGKVDVDPTTNNPSNNPYELVLGEALNPNHILGLYDTDGDGNYGEYYYTIDPKTSEEILNLAFDWKEWSIDPAAFTFGGALPHYVGPGTGMSGDLPSINFDTNYLIAPPVTGIPGDTNDDGIVDSTDYTTFTEQFGSSGLELSADFNNDEKVNLDDFAILRGNYGYGIGGAPEATTPTTTPEPSTLSY